jgi:spermidine synthase
VINIYLYIIFFFSGASALIFETLWFRLAGLTFGNSIWSSSVVLSSFMGGLAIGNALVARYGHKAHFPVRLYAFVEAVIAISGFGLVLILPNLTEFLVPLFRWYIENHVVLNILRLVIVFLLMLIPATAMGATLPLLVRPLRRGKTDFGEVLGRLYGLNTLGAVLGAISGEWFLISWFGIKGTGFFSALLNCAAAATALWVSRKFDLLTREGAPVKTQQEVQLTLPVRSRIFLTAGFLSGGILLALEVIWFRFLLLFFSSSSYIFAMMLAVILSGIGVGGLIAAWLLRFDSKAYRLLTSFSLLSGTLTIALYGSFNFLERFQVSSLLLSIEILQLYLMFPVSLLSGIIFTMIGASIYEDFHREETTAGLLTLTNTIGGMFGAFLGGFFLIPLVGLEKSFFYLALMYGVVALLTFVGEGRLGKGYMKYLQYSTLALFSVAVVLFPFGKMEKKYLHYPYAAFLKNTPSTQVVRVREGLTETSQYLRTDAFGFPYYFTLFTNNFKMTGTDISGRRLRKLFVYLPLAVNPDITNALLICYGTGETAKALTDSKDIKGIDIVDISKDILEMSDVVFPDYRANPLNDPRVKTHVEDGRFFLQTTSKHYDLITAEPPPPRHAGVVNLYTQEYFQLIYDHLSEGGIVTYWLPVYMIREAETKSILKGFCNVFNDCSLWWGASLDLVMVGTRNLQKRTTVDEFSRQWHDPIVAPELRALGFEMPEQMGAMLLADTDYLAHDFLRDSLPLTDNYPMRLVTDHLVATDQSSNYSYWAAIPDQFENNATINKLWPETLKTKTKQYLQYQRIITEALYADIGFPYPYFPYLHEVLAKSSLKFPVLLMMGSDSDSQRNLAKALSTGLPEEAVLYPLAIKALSERNYLLAEKLLAKYQELHPNNIIMSRQVYYFRIYLSLLMRNKEQAKNLTKKLFSLYGSEEVSRNKIFWEWIERTFGFSYRNL